MRLIPVQSERRKSRTLRVARANRISIGYLETFLYSFLELVSVLCYPITKLLHCVEWKSEVDESVPRNVEPPTFRGKYGKVSKSKNETREKDGRRERESVRMGRSDHSK